MAKKTSLHSPAYAQIALDIAARIARGELEENSKVSGRTKMSSEYGVSPETIRRAMILLEQTGIVYVAEKSGVIIKSKEKAHEYLQQYSYDLGVEKLKDELKQALSQKAAIDKKIVEIVDQIVDMNNRLSNIDPLKKFEFVIPEDSWLVNRSLKQSKFYQNTQATVIALKRDRQQLTSPGPDIKFKGNDVIVVIGNVDTMDTVRYFIEKKSKD